MDGTVMRTLGSQGSGPGQLSKPRGVFVDGNGNVLVGDQSNKRVVVFYPDGTTTHFATPGDAFDVLITSSNRLVVSGVHFVAEYAWLAGRAQRGHVDGRKRTQRWTADCAVFVILCGFLIASLLAYAY